MYSTQVLRAFALSAVVAIAAIAGAASWGSSPMPPLEAIAWSLLGASATTYGAIVGAGGGFLMVPALLLLGHRAPEEAAGTSLLVVMVGAIVASWTAHAQRRVDVKSALVFALAMVPGSLLGAWISPLLKEGRFELSFAALIAVLAIGLLIRPVPTAGSAGARWLSFWPAERALTDASGEVHRYRFSMGLGTLLSVAIGLMSSALGIGGGILQVPAMIHLLAFPPLVATATSQLVLTASAIVGSTTHVALGHVEFRTAAVLAGGALIGGRLGALLAPKIRGPRTIRLLALGLLAVSLRLALSGAR